MRIFCIHELEHLIDVYRLGYIPILVTSNLYLICRGYRLGVLARANEKIMIMLFRHHCK
ncbi:MAG: hypothetical protein QW101_01085 [Ignisphaera sp.]